MIYYALSLLSLAFGNCTLKIKFRGKKKIEVMWIIGFIMILLCAFRSTSVGSDTNMYGRIFERYDSVKDIVRYFHGTDYAYYCISLFFHKYLNFRRFLFFCAVISIFPVLYVIDRHSHDKGLSLALYIMFGYYTFAFSGLRQGIAIGIIMIAYHFSREKKLAKYLVAIGIAFLFHFSAILFLPFYWVEKIPYNRKTRIIWFVGILAVFALRTTLVSFVYQYQRFVATMGYRGSNRMLIFMIITDVLGVLILNKQKKDVSSEGKALLYTQLISTVICIVAVSFAEEWTRMYFYYHILLILFVPFLIHEEKGINRIVLYLAFAAVGLYLVYSQILPPYTKLVPYTMFDNSIY